MGAGYQNEIDLMVARVVLTRNPFVSESLTLCSRVECPGPAMQTVTPSAWCRVPTKLCSTSHPASSTSSSCQTLTLWKTPQHQVRRAYSPPTAQRIRVWFEKLNMCYHPRFCYRIRRPAHAARSCRGGDGGDRPDIGGVAGVPPAVPRVAALVRRHHRDARRGRSRLALEQDRRRRRYADEQLLEQGASRSDMLPSMCHKPVVKIASHALIFLLQEWPIFGGKTSEPIPATHDLLLTG